MSGLLRGSELQSTLQQVSNQLLTSLNNGVEDIATLWTPQTCPEPLLPWLAWSQSVQEWDEQWSLDLKRQVVANSFDQHRHLGTRYAITKALQPFNLGAQITEWFEHSPMREAGTFHVDVYVSNQGIDLPLIQETRRRIDSVKRKSVDYSIQMHLQGNLGVATTGVFCSSTMTTIFPLS
ncbi:phage tail protein I [Pseudoalteromonas byunsanensis]|uniref:Phage tail protein I n=1 Tax=Pseudoalteromonas byunsanensis TaxID=327939 RepID=A0A1S1NDM4_9GAMM|nr:phage tail protein I [Pseudoalteromonas byunsanensis]OHU96831.1 phage tail protein I [Pseudoalteromonas byunsanensis]